jgi:sugar/nucleoside kinase (ribokinase family)
MPHPAPERSGILAGGNWIVDHVKTIDAWPPEDSLVNILAEYRSNGGSPYNILKNLSRLGAAMPLQAVGLVGADAAGDFILEDCRRAGIDTTQLRRTDGAATSYTDVMTVRTTGRRTFFHQRGANALLSPGHFDFSRTRCRYFHLGYLLLLDGLDQLEGGVPRARGVLAQARAAGLRTSLDCVSEHSDRFAAVVRPVLPEVDVLFANDFEAERVTGQALRAGGRLQPAAVEAAARDLLAAGVRETVILHFVEGAYARDAQDREVWQPSLQVPAAELKGTAGAGDAFASGVLHSLHEGGSLADALRLGVCVAACSLASPTCSEGVRPVEEARRLERSWGFRPLPA